MKRILIFISLLFLNLNIYAQVLNKINPILEIGGSIFINNPIVVVTKYQSGYLKMVTEIKFSGKYLVLPSTKFGLNYMFTDKIGINTLVGIPNRYRILLHQTDSIVKNGKLKADAEYNTELLESYIPLELGIIFKVNEKLDLIINKSSGLGVNNFKNSSLGELSLICNIKTTKYASIYLGIATMEYSLDNEIINIYSANFGFRYKFETQPYNIKYQKSIKTF